jgi:hypothetical protein
MTEIERPTKRGLGARFEAVFICLRKDSRKMLKTQGLKLAKNLVLAVYYPW